MDVDFELGEGEGQEIDLDKAWHGIHSPIHAAGGRKEDGRRHLRELTIEDPAVWQELLAARVVRLATLGPQ